jgi:hypothetical protein
MRLLPPFSPVEGYCYGKHQRCNDENIDDDEHEDFGDVDPADLTRVKKVNEHGGAFVDVYNW